MCAALKHFPITPLCSLLHHRSGDSSHAQEVVRLQALDTIKRTTWATSSDQIADRQSSCLIRRYAMDDTGPKSLGPTYSMLLGRQEQSAICSYRTGCLLWQCHFTRSRLALCLLLLLEYSIIRTRKQYSNLVGTVRIHQIIRNVGLTKHTDSLKNKHWKM